LGRRPDGHSFSRQLREKFGVGNLMAFGFGFNKQKVLSTAEKFVQQGKLPNAISEYEKILKADPKDLTVMNTIGDLYSRSGETDKAAECFKNVGDAYASQGFTVKAIAMYKKLSKLKTSMECVLRLAELYTQQGLFNDARTQYLQVAEEFLKTGQLDQAVRIFEKTLEMDPDNVAMRTKLAEVYVRLDKKPEAWQILTSAAESLRAKGQLAAADEILQRMLKLEPGNSYALVLRGWAALEAGDAKAAIESLTKVADLDSNPEGLRILFHAYLRTKNFADAGILANKLASVHDDIAAIDEYAEALVAAQEFREALQIYEQHFERLFQKDGAKLIEAVQSTIGHVRDDPKALQIVLGLLEKAGENAHLTEIYELLAHSYVQAGDLEKAREYYLKLTQLEPANQMHMQNYQQVLDKVGTATTSNRITAEEAAALTDELEATAPAIEQRHENEAAIAVRAALTDAELFISYNMPAKALAPLLAALPIAPRDQQLNQKLAGLHARAGRLAETGACCRTLESIYHDAGHANEASKYADLAARCEESSGTVSVTAPLAHPAPQAAVAAVASAEPAVAEFVASAPAAPDFAVTTPAAAEFEVSAPVHDAETEVVAHAAEVAPAVESVVAAATPARKGLFFHAPAAAVSAVAASKVVVPEPVAEDAVASEPVVAEAAEFAVAPALQESASASASTEDLSHDWEQDLHVDAPSATGAGAAQHAGTQAPPVSLEESVEEVRFYLGQGMTEQAEELLVRLEAKAPESPEVEVLRMAVESVKQAAALPDLHSEVSIEEPEAAEAPYAAEEPVTAAPVHASIPTPQPWPQERPVLHQMVSEIEQSLGDEFLAEPEKAAAPQIEPEIELKIEPKIEPQPEAQPETVHAKGEEFRSGTLDDFVSDLEASLGSDFLPDAVAHSTAAAPVEHAEVPVAMAAAAPASAPQIAPQKPAMQPRVIQRPAFQQPVIQQAARPASQPIQPSKAAAAASADPGVDLSDMFGELKKELESGVTGADDDPETHYNLGVAFREMGLLDEAIGELQKVIQAVEHGHTFPQMIQTYTWLAQCFLDKGVPEAAVRWYQKALQLPSLDQETMTALHYELGSALESAGNKPAALSNFLEAYGSNIDYRDVAERIKALRP
jgi:tetratricopeptide (TPR) repeat protein